MENVVKLDSWDAFKHSVHDLKAASAAAAVDDASYRSTLLFRGQSDCNWPLLTTLDRCREAPYGFFEYFRLALVARPEIETFTGRQWDVPQMEELMQQCQEYEGFKAGSFPAYEYLVYLRHHGFPSPLLDWSESAYIAAFFAFENAVDKESVAVYCYQEYIGKFKSSSSDEPQIRGLGPYVRSHARHFLQHSQYTVCGLFDSNGWSFAPHESVFNLGTPDQDRLTKFILPASERQKVLLELDEYNLNAFSLFQTDEALLKTIWFRGFESPK